MPLIERAPLAPLAAMPPRCLEEYVALCGEVLRAAYVTNTVTRTKPTPNIAADNASDETPITNHSDRVTVFSWRPDPVPR